MKIQIFLLTVLSFVVFSSFEKKIPKACKSIEDLKQLNIRNFEKDPIHNQIITCSNEIIKLKKNSKKIINLCVSSERNIQDKADFFKKEFEKKKSYEDDLTDAMKDFEKKKMREQKTAANSLEVIKEIRKKVNQIENHRATPHKKRILKILDILEAFYLKLINQKRKSTKIEKLKNKIEKYDQYLNDLEEEIEKLRKEYEKNKKEEENAQKTVANTEIKCSNKKDKLEKLKKNLEKSQKELDGKIEECIKDVLGRIKILQKEFDNLVASEKEWKKKDPKQSCDAKLKNINQEIEKKMGEEKKVNEEIEKLSKENNEKEKIASESKTKKSEFEEKFNVQKKICKILKEKLINDPSIMQELESIQKLIVIVSNLGKNGTLSESSVKDINELLQKFVDELKKALKEQEEKMNMLKNEINNCDKKQESIWNEFVNATKKYEEDKKSFEKNSVDLKVKKENLIVIQNTKKMFLSNYSAAKTNCDKKNEEYKNKLLAFRKQIENLSLQIRSLSSTN